MTFLDENQRMKYFAMHYKNYHPAFYEQLYQTNQYLLQPDIEFLQYLG